VPPPVAVSEDELPWHIIFGLADDVGTGFANATVTVSEPVHPIASVTVSVYVVVAPGVAVVLELAGLPKLPEGVQEKLVAVGAVPVRVVEVAGQICAYGPASTAGVCDKTTTVSVFVPAAPPEPVQAFRSTTCA
jgi:hypothetical protein